MSVQGSAGVQLRKPLGDPYHCKDPLPERCVSSPRKWSLCSKNGIGSRPWLGRQLHRGEVNCTLLVDRAPPGYRIIQDSKMFMSQGDIDVKPDITDLFRLVLNNKVGQKMHKF